MFSPTTITALLCAIMIGNLGAADDMAPRDVHLTVPGKWKSRPLADEKAGWTIEDTPAKVTIKSDRFYTFELANDVADEQLAGLKVLKDAPLRSVTVVSSRLTDDGIEKIARIGSIRSLYLSACRKVTDEGLAHLKKTPNLEELWITANVQITDDGMKSLAELKKLRFLSLYGCEKVTDEGARRLKDLPDLKFASFQKTGVTDAGIADLQKALPECKANR